MSRPGLVRAAAVAALLAVGLGVQLYFFAAFPQPVLFGDPRGFYEAGQRLLQAAGRLAGGEDVSAVFESVRGLFFLLGVGTLFAALEAVRPGDFAFFRVVFALFNTAAMLGVFLLARRLAGSDLGGFVALAVAVVYPAFSVQTGRLYPDPVTGCLFVWSAWLYLEGMTRGRRRWLVAAALTLTAAVLVRSQLALFMLLVLPLVFAASAPWWWRDRAARRQALALALAFLPLAAAWVGVERAVGTRDDVTQFGNLTFRPPYPYGFWQFLDGDGWSTAYRFKSEPYAVALWKENEKAPGLFHSRARQLAFTARWVADRPLASVGIVLNNVYRLFDRPANDYKWDYPFSYPAQVALQRAIVIAALAGLALFAAENLAALGVFFVPLSLAALHGLTFVWPRYNVPVMPILIAAAGAAVARVVLSRGAWRDRAAARVGLAAAGLLLLAVLSFVPVPEAARVARHVGLLAALAVPFLVVRRVAAIPRAGRWAAAVWLALAVVVTGHALRDRQWHERTLVLGDDVAAVEQSIRLGPDALARVRAAREAFVAFDLSVPRGDTSGLEVEVAGRRYPGSALVPTMPRLRESTSTGGRDWRGYPQWWVLPLDPAVLPRDASAPLVVRITARAGTGVRLRTDRWAGQQAAYEGPSFGERPYMVALKLEYDGDYRLPVRYPLRSAGTRTAIVRDGRPREAAFVARIRLLTLVNDSGELRWRTAPAPSASSAVGFFGWSGERGEARLLVDGAPVLSFPLDRSDDWTVEGGGWRLCRRALGIRGDRPYGAFVLSGPTVAQRPLELAVEFVTGMDDRPMYFVLDRRRSHQEVAPFAAACGAEGPLVAGIAEVIDASRNAYPDDTGRWTVGEVF